MISYTNDGWLDSVEYPEPLLPDYDVFSASAQAQCYNDGPDDAPAVKCQWQRRVYVNNRASDAAEGSGGSVILDVSPALNVRPGMSYLIAVEASSTFNAAAVIDPLLEPHPENPDIIIEFPNAAPDPNPLPMMAGITPEQLLARGIDPQAFIDVGFLASTPPPPPPPRPTGDKSWCWPGFWLKNAVIYGASAWPASVPTYYDYNQTAGQLSGCPVASGNPTLVQVLQSVVVQNPTPYFSTGLKDAGLNCVADYLSRQSGLRGTKSRQQRGLLDRPVRGSHKVAIDRRGGCRRRLCRVRACAQLPGTPSAVQGDIHSPCTDHRFLESPNHVGRQRLDRRGSQALRPTSGRSATLEAQRLVLARIQRSGNIALRI
jgi:hypothetical protein